MISAVIVGFGALYDKLNAMGNDVALEGEVNRVMAEAVAIAQSRAPVDTGDYRRSMSHVTVGSGVSVVGYAGSNKPQARRLERGFFGEDSWGRFYNQAPRPHWQQAYEYVVRRARTIGETMFK